MKNKLPAHLPEDYSGSIAQWCTELQLRGLWDGEGWYGDVYIDEDVYEEILEKTELDF